MSKVFGYIRVSTDKQTIENQRAEINRYCGANDLFVNTWYDFEVSSRKSDEERGITKLLSELQEDDILIVSELSRLGRSTLGVLTLIDKLAQMGVTVILIKQNLKLSKNSKNTTDKIMVTMFSMFAEVERDLISQRTKEALASRKGTGKLGHKKGALLRSEYDKSIGRILELRELGLSIQKIIKQIGYGSIATLNTYLKKRFEKNMLGGYSLKKELEGKYEIIEGVLIKK